MSEQEALTIVLGALDQLTPRRTDPPTLMELTLCLGYSEAELDEAFTTLFNCRADEALTLFSQDALRLRPTELLSDYPTRLTLDSSYTGAVSYCFFPYRFGELLLATTPLGLCYSSFTLEDWQGAYAELRQLYPKLRMTSRSSTNTSSRRFAISKPRRRRFFPHSTSSARSSSGASG